MADWKYDPLAMLGGQRLLSNPDPDAAESLKKYYGTGTKAWKKYGEFLNPTRGPSDMVHAKGGSVTRPGAASHGKLIRKYGG